MEFENWWSKLTLKEQTMIGENNAKFVWNEAQQDLKNRLSFAFDQMPFGNTSQSFAAYVREFK
jgi:hypothetical protein